MAENFYIFCPQGKAIRILLSYWACDQNYNEKKIWHVAA